MLKNRCSMAGLKTVMGETYLKTFTLIHHKVEILCYSKSDLQYVNKIILVIKSN